MPSPQSAKPTESGYLFLRTSQLFASLDDETFAHIYSQLEWLGLELDETLFIQGHPGDSLYILVYGRLGISVKDEEGQARFVGEIHPGEPIGEMGMFTDEPRSATIWALRDVVVVRLSRDKFMRLLEQHPKTMLAMNKLLVQRLRRTTSANKEQIRHTQIFSLLPVSRELPIEAFGRDLARELGHFGHVLYISSDDVHHGNQKGIPAHPTQKLAERDYAELLSWLNEQEQRHGAIVLQADPTLTPWTQFCMRYADALLLLGDAQQRPNAFVMDPRLQSKPRSGLARKRRLILLQPDHIAIPTGTARWLDVFSVDAHHHVRLSHSKDMKRLARFLTGNAVALAMAGGAARGFAHIGVFRALDELGIPIDLTCGASAGANLGAQYACGWNDQQIMKKTRPFFGMRMFADIDLPIVSLLRTKALKKILDQLYGEIHIEDMWRHFFAASSNLTRAEVVLFHRGKVKDAIRASGALPGFYPPFVQPSGEMLVDGAILANLPAAYIDRSCFGKLISVNVIPSLDTNICSGLPEGVPSWRMLAERLNPLRSSPYPNIFDILMRSIFLNSIKDADEIRMKSDLYLEPALGRFGFFDMQAFEMIVNVGYHSAIKEIEAWLQRDTEIRRIVDIDQC